MTLPSEVMSMFKSMQENIAKLEKVQKMVISSEKLIQAPGVILKGTVGNTAFVHIRDANIRINIKNIRTRITSRIG